MYWARIDMAGRVAAVTRGDISWPSVARPQEWVAYPYQKFKAGMVWDRVNKEWTQDV